MKTYEYTADRGGWYTRCGLVQAHSLTSAYGAAKDLLREGEVLRGISELTPEQAELALEAEVVEAYA